MKGTGSSLQIEKLGVTNTKRENKNFIGKGDVKEDYRP